MNIKKHIPNALTCCNLLCGCFGILAALDTRLDTAFFLVISAAIFDFFDGFAARMLKVSSPIGKDLDSLADMVTFGVLPGFIMYRLLSLILGTADHSDVYVGHDVPYDPSQLLPYLAFLIPVFSALRLAKFNNDPRQTDGFIGLATPSNTLLISSIGYIFYTKIFAIVMSAPNNLQMNEPGTLLQVMMNSWVLIGITVVMSFLLISEIPMFALKFKNFGWKDNEIRYVLLISAVILLILFQLSATPFIIILYILLAVINNTFGKKEKINS
jgi:CDP-diacylglycerol--serine O-phosphatidyltransferase